MVETEFPIWDRLILPKENVDWAWNNSKATQIVDAERKTAGLPGAHQGLSGLWCCYQRLVPHVIDTLP